MFARSILGTCILARLCCCVCQCGNGEIDGGGAQLGEVEEHSWTYHTLQRLLKRVWSDILVRMQTPVSQYQDQNLPCRISDLLPTAPAIGSETRVASGSDGSAGIFTKLAIRFGRNSVAMYSLVIEKLTSRDGLAAGDF